MEYVRKAIGIKEVLRRMRTVGVADPQIKLPARTPPSASLPAKAKDGGSHESKRRQPRQVVAKAEAATRQNLHFSAPLSPCSMPPKWSADHRFYSVQPV